VIGLCPASSPLSASPCALPDHEAYHAAGHESRRVENRRAVWPPTNEERERWKENARARR